MTDIPGYDSFIKIEPLHKGWSSDQKFYIETTDGRRLLLRVADIAERDRKQAEFAQMLQIAELGIPIPQPLAFGICGGGKNVYTLLTWCDGEDSADVLRVLPETEQYVFGLKSGEILRKIHSIPVPETQEEWAARFNRKTDLKIKRYRECGLRFDGDDAVIGYLESNRHLLKHRPQCLQHGDYHVGNMVIGEDRDLSVIDFNRMDYGDPWEEFNRIVWSATASPHFATGQLRGYFGGEPPMEFFRLLAFYIAGNMLSSVYWAIPFGREEVDVMMKQAQDVLQWFNRMGNPVPAWYRKDFFIQYIDGVPLKLKAPFDLSFLSRYGTVFKVFDDQDSGNLCFGVQKGDERLFIKFAGAPTEQYDGTPEEAVERLKATVPVYRDLAHPNLIRLRGAEAISGGFAAVFDWADGECMGRMYPMSHRRFMQMPLETRVRVYEGILAFHAHAAERGYVAIDFYDGSILYDFAAGKTTVCDIDFYAKAPYVNRMGRLWGSSRFMSPEEFVLGAAIDEVTNVYTMGATAFALFADCDRTVEKWPLGHALYEVAKKAVNDDRSMRQQSIRQLAQEWANALEGTHV